VTFLQSRPLSETAAAIFLDRNNERFLSAASAWEIGIKHAFGRLPLPESPDIFVPTVREASGIVALDINEESVLSPGRLPDLHSDPFDLIPKANNTQCASCGEAIDEMLNIG
jgi:PIN domain nuclease of toxin-antitoxin system